MDKSTSTTTAIRIILVDDHDQVRKALKQLIEANPDFQVIGDFDNGQDAIDNAKELNPDIMLVDINMEPVNGFTVVKEITQYSTTIKIIGLSNNNDPIYASRMLNLGAKGYVIKAAAFTELNEAIYEVNKGNVYLCNEIRLLMKK